jgi:spermidine synthase
MDIDPDKWLRDYIDDNFIQMHHIEEVLYDGRTKYQSAQVMRSSRLGIILVLDGKVQCSEKDEFVYHEALVQPAMITHPEPETVFIAGGGEGATLREVLSHKSVKKAVMVDIDEEVVNLSKKYLPHFSRGAFEDKRTELYHVDARQYLENSKDWYDVIIIDLPDPIEKGPAYLLYTREFYEMVSSRLTENGVIGVQSGSASLLELTNFTSVNNTLRSVFPMVSQYGTYLPSYGCPWGFCCASLKKDTSGLSVEEVDKRIRERSLNGLKFYDGLTHRGMFSLSKNIREALAKQRRLITDKEPLYLYKVQGRPEDRP